MNVKIPYRNLGRINQKVFILGLGGYHIGMRNVSEEASQEIIRTAIDQGVNFLDNSWDYSDGASEIRMGKALRDGYREKIFLMTKIDGRDRNTAEKQIDESISRLGTHIDLLLLDEPTAGLDPFGIVDVRDMLKRIVSEGRTILLSSHQLSEVQQTCSRVTVVNKGRTVAEGSVLELTRDLHGGSSYKAEFSSLNPRLLNGFKQINDVEEVLIVEGNIIRILLSKDYDIRQTMARTAIEHGSLLLSCEREEMSLEELFISLVKNSNSDR